MKIAVAMDGDGHFMAAPYTDQIKIKEILEKIQDGDFIANMDKSDLLIYEDPAPLSTIEWAEFIYGIQQRGILEIIEI